MNSNKRSKLITMFAILTLCCSVTTDTFAQTADWFVDGATGSDSNLGNSWAQAYDTLFKALDSAVAGDIIFVAEGTYFPDDGTGSDNDRSKSFDMVADVAVYGGFQNGDTFIDRDFIANETILSGEIGSAGNTDNSYRVVYFKDLTGTAAILDGFTVRDGFNDTPGGDGEGGGIEINGTANATIKNCFITENEAEFGGGGIAIFTGNAGIVEIRNCDFYLNVSQLDGGGAIIKNSFTDVNFINCNFSENDAVRGGAVAGLSGEPLNFINCVFTENTATGGVFGVGGAVRLISSGSAEFVNCLFAYNVADDNGGAIDSDSGSDVELLNCTIVKNHAGDEAGGVSMPGSTTLNVINSIFWDNTDDDGVTDIEHEQINSAGTVNVHYSFIHDLSAYQDAGSTNIGVTGTDPGFKDENGSDANAFDASDDFRLLYDSMNMSLCVDSGNNSDVPCDEFDVDEDGSDCVVTPEDTPDLDFFDRIIDGDEDLTEYVDMGAYEAQTCIWDLNDDCTVNTTDLLILFANWGPCDDCNDCPADFNGDCTVNTTDLLILFANWGPCYCAPIGSSAQSFEDELADACLTQANWDDYVGVMNDPLSPQSKKDRYQCWMEHYINDCNKCLCLGPVPCPNPDPYH